MLDKLAAIETRYTEIETQLQSSETYSDQKLYAKLNRELKELTPVVAAYRELQKYHAALDEALEMVSDPEMRDLAKDEIEFSKAEIERVENEIKVLLLPSDPNDAKNVIIEIRGGAGGDEAALFAHSLQRMYTMYAETRRWKTEVAYINETELGGVKEVSFIIEGDGAYSRLKFESGVHRVQRVPDTESSGRIHTSTVTVAVLPEMDEVEFAINPVDLQIDTFRSSGAGGQHVNKTESAIRITHLPTGTVVECQDERSQHKNRERAMKILTSRLYEAECERQAAENAAERRSQVGTGDRSERIRTYNFNENRVSDHRIKLTLYKLDRILDGDMDEVIDALIMADQAAKLTAINNEQLSINN
ncbi:MAG: peptide chain release factor 1 [Oscillospiraceae bacterium]|jgi:peptide chain release factor 1|nr:peptide chain release factor 1 [Oscillospiraceae bacterium]